MFGRHVRSHGDGRDEIVEKASRSPAHRLIDCSRPNITCPGNQPEGSIFSHPYSEKISTSWLNGRLEGQRSFFGSGTNKIVVIGDV